MDIKTFTAILSDKHFLDYKKLNYKYSEDFKEFLLNLEELYYKELPLKDFDSKNLVFIDNYKTFSQTSVKLLLKPQNQNYGIKVAEDEIISTSAIESIDFNRDSVRKILRGMAPENEQENRILGLKHGLEFISDTTNKITEENLYKLYMMTVGNFLENDDKLLNGNFYRHDTVFVISDRIEHSGLDHKKVPECMKNLIKYINSTDETNDLVKAAIIHFYFAYIHPYFDGNGRTARLLHLWFLIQKGYQSSLFIPFSSQIEKTKKAYYDAFTLIESNKKFSGRIDATPFIVYFSENVYKKTDKSDTETKILALYENALRNHQITKKEAELWKFVLSYYGTDEFSTKQLERDFSDAAYATIRGFVLKFCDLDILTSTNYGTRIKYKIKEM